jgi:hypothetical protein
VLPPSWALYGFGIIYLCLELFRRAGQPWFAELDQLVPRYQVALVLISSVAYGIFRVAAFHPAYRLEYLKWLKTTPWMPTMPLPFGPVHLVVWDAFSWIIFGWLFIYNGLWGTLIIALMLFVGVYLLFLAFALFKTGESRFAWAILFGFGFAGLVESVVYLPLVLLAIYVIGYVGLRRSMRSYPWPIEKPLIPSDANLHGNRPAGMGLGWPYDRLIPHKLEPCIGLETGLALSILSAWYLFVISRFFNPLEMEEFLHGVWVSAVVGTMAARWCIYRLGYSPPISLLGRICTGRLIIPRYDQVLVAPLASVLLGLTLPPLLGLLGVQKSISIPIAVGVVLAIAISCGPTLSTWRLTGWHRITTCNNRQYYTEL